MISIIILSYRDNLLGALLNNIRNTIGNCSYETIVFDNSSAKYALCSAYNEGIKKAQGTYFCFVHEDVIFKSENWGNEFIQSFQQNSRLGLLGILGSKFKSAYPTGWYNPVNNCNYHTGNIFQGNNNNFDAHFKDFSIGACTLDYVVCLDGVLLFTKREIVDTINFDEELLKGYHGYDIDFSLQVHFAGYQIAVLKSVQLFHFSPGNTDEKWKDAIKVLSMKWRDKLPTYTTNNQLLKTFREFETIYIHEKGNRYYRAMRSLITVLGLYINKLDFKKP